MADYPDPDEEYELMYADELELLKEQEGDLEPNIARKPPIQAKRSLDFSDHAVKTPSVSNKASNIVPNDVTLSQSLQPLEEVLTPNNNPNKRTAVELFGDIGDIDFDVDENELPSKRQKTEEEVDSELIDKIIEGRKLKQMLLEPSRLQKDVKSNYNVKENVTLNIPRWAFLPVTNNEGDRMYVKLESEESWEHSLATTTSQYSLRQTYEDAWVEARKILEKKEEQQSQQASQQATQPLCEVIQNLDINGNSLWVDKYKPLSYVDLLSDEPVNRALLHWLHLWDKVVFKKEIKSKEPQQRNAFHKRTGQFELTNKWKGKKEAEPELDPDGRPHHKVALLCGPPGVGKTTLAHLLAKLAGYRPVELNASDERSTDAFRTALHNATLMTSVLDADRRPNCLVLDEIDGAPLPTIELLVKWCTATSTEGGKKKKSNPLKRPVIAICNDLYATSLRPLRPVSLIITVGGVSTPRLSARLSMVCESEHCKTSPACLSALAARANGDVRAALQILHVAAVMGKQLRMQDVHNLAIGTKDCHKSLLQALTAIFTVNDADSGAIMKTLQAAGEYDRIADGIFENYITARVDAQLVIAREVTSWLRTFDLLSSWTNRTQNYSVYGSLPLCLMRCHLLLAQRNPERVRFPTVAGEMYRRQMQLQSIIHSVWRGSTIVSTLSRRALTLDVLPLLPFILSPNLPHANVQLLNEAHRKTLESCAGAMCDYGLQYIQQRAPDGFYTTVLEPDVYAVAFFGNADRARPTPPIRQAIARAQQLEMIRRNEEMTTRMSNRKPGNESRPPPKTNTSAARKTDPAPIVEEVEEVKLPNHLQRLQPKAIVKATPQVQKDFFGRIVPLSQVQKSDVLPDVIASSNVFYQYREGFNNAVRRNVRVKDIL